MCRSHCRMTVGREADRNCDPTKVGGVKRTKELALFQMQEISRQPTETDKASKRKEFGMRENENPHSIYRLIHSGTYAKSRCLLYKFYFRSTPVETLHTILLGPYKYLLKVFVPRLTAQQLLARMRAFNYSGFDGKVLGNMVYHHQSFVGRDYEAFAQMAPLILSSQATSQMPGGRCY